MSSTDIDRRVVVICGTKNSGKTTLISRLVEELTRRKIKTAVIKHDGHDFNCDIPNTDSYRFTRAGAYGVAVFSNKRLFVHKAVYDTEELNLIELFPEVDIIFVEGLKNSIYPKIEVVRKEISQSCVSNKVGRFLIVTDCDINHFDEDTAGFDEIDVILDYICKITKIAPV